MLMLATNGSLGEEEGEYLVCSVWTYLHKIYTPIIHENYWKPEKGLTIQKTVINLYRWSTIRYILEQNLL